MSEMQTIQWFPGHMTKTKRQIQSSLKLVDAVAEIIDARIPVSSRNPDLAKLVQNKPRVILLNKCDMANQTATKMWIDYFKKQNLVAIPVDCKSGRGLDKFAPAVNTVMSHKIARLKEKGMVNPTIRIMIVGIPNVGKSSFINKMVKKNRAKVEDRPGFQHGCRHGGGIGQEHHTGVRAWGAERDGTDRARQTLVPATRHARDGQ